jgi:hypothetical protein
MGRQHTTWISEENWKKLENIGGDSVSAKIGNAISMADPDREMVINAKMRQLDRTITALKAIQADVNKRDSPDWGKKALLDNIALVIEDVYWVVNQ